MNAPAAGAGDPSTTHRLTPGQLARDTPAEEYGGTPMPDFDPLVPSPARMYDYYLGGRFP